MPIKKRTVIPRYKDIVVVRWEDAVAGGSDQHDTQAAALKAYEPCFRSSVGMYVGYARSKERRALLIATDDDNYKGTPDAIGGVIQIPAGMVVHVEVIKTHKPK